MFKQKMRFYVFNLKYNNVMKIRTPTVIFEGRKENETKCHLVTN